MAASQGVPKKIRMAAVVAVAGLVGVGAIAGGVMALRDRSPQALATQDLLNAVRDGARKSSGNATARRAAQEAMVADALRRGADPNAHYGTDPSPLMATFRYVGRHVPGVYRDRDTTLEAKDRWPVLLMAASHGETGVLRRLAVAGARWKTHGEGGETALYLASEIGSPSAVQFLLDLGADPNEKAGIDLTPEQVAQKGALPLTAAVYSPDVTRLLLAKGADPTRTVQGLPVVPYLRNVQKRMTTFESRHPQFATARTAARMADLQTSVALIEAAAKTPKPG